MFKKRQNRNLKNLDSVCEFTDCPRGIGSVLGLGRGLGRSNGGRDLGNGSGSQIGNNNRSLGSQARCQGGEGRGFGCGRGRRKTRRNICGAPVSTYFKPSGIAVTDLEVINLELDEFEALRLKNVEELDQTEASKNMEISQSTFARILDSAYKKVSTALVNGKAIEIDK